MSASARSTRTFSCANPRRVRLSDASRTAGLHHAAAGIGGTPVNCRVQLDLTSEGLVVKLAGELDVSTIHRLNVVLRAVECVRRPVLVDLEHVGFADSHGLMPIWELDRRRVNNGLPPVRLMRVPARVARVWALLPADC